MALARRLALAVLGTWMHAGLASAADSPKAQCAAAYESSQELRAAGKLSSAREKLVICAQDACPAFVQSDCAQWLIEVQKEMPTITIAARDRDGADTTQVRLIVDGQVVAEQLDGKPVPIDPGAHKLRFELEGSDPIEQQLLVNQGQKDRTVVVSFAPRGADLPESSPYEGQATEEPAAAEPARDAGKPGPLRPYAFVAGGVGAAGIVGWAVLGALGKSKENELRDTCSPDCPQSEVDGVHTKYLLADISLGVGIAGLGTGVALFFLSQPKPAEQADSASVGFDLHAAPGGAKASVFGRF